MACLTTIINSRVLSCGAPSSQLGSPKSALIINHSDIQSFTVGAGTASAAITMKPGTRGWPLEVANNTTVVKIALKGGETYPQQHDVSIETTLFSHTVNNDSTGRAWSGGANGQYVFVVEHAAGTYKVYGLGAPLEVLSVEGSSMGIGFPRTTFGVEDWQTGTTVYNITKAQYEALQVAAGSGEGGKVTPPSKPDEPDEPDTPSTQKRM